MSALKQDLGGLVDALLQRIPPGPKYFPDDQLTDQPERFVVSELIREKIFELTKEEIPYSTAVVIDQVKEEPGLTPQERGLLLHEVLQRFFEGWQASGRGAITPVNLDDALAEFPRVAADRLASVPDADRALVAAALR